MDIVVADQVIVEVTSVDGVHPIHEAQLLTYVKLSGIRTGLLINVNSVVVKDGIKRLVYG